jgi:hypothetical protein
MGRRGTFAILPVKEWIPVIYLSVSGDWHLLLQKEIRNTICKVVGSYRTAFTTSWRGKWWNSLEKKLVDFKQTFAFVINKNSWSWEIREEFRTWKIFSTQLLWCRTNAFTDLNKINYTLTLWKFRCDFSATWTAKEENKPRKGK